MRKLRKWKGSEHKWIRDNWQTKSDREMAEHFGVTVDSFVQIRRRLGLKRPLNYSHLRGRIPPHWNAHKKQKPFWTTMAGKPTQMIVVYEEGKPRKHMLYTRYLWIQKNGPIPEGYVIAAKNGDLNDRSEGNLVCVTRAECGRMMQARRSHELCKAIRAKQVQTLRKRRQIEAYVKHEPYQFAA